MIRSIWYRHPLLILAALLLALASSLAVYITTYLNVHNAFSNFLREHHFGPIPTMDHSAWVNIVILSVLVFLIIVGLVLVFTFYQKVIQLYYLQQNFINGFTHELKTPVASLKLLLETFSMHNLPQEQRQKFLEFMKKDLERLSTNIARILDLARFEEKKYHLTLQIIKIYQFLQDLLAKNANSFQQASLILESSQEFVLEADPHLMEVLFMNILTNGINYNESVQPQILIKIGQSGRFLEISFHDNGIGIAPRDLAKIFKKFYRVKKAVKGSGIGLYLARQIVKLHRGKLKVVSAGIGKGAIFTVCLPRGRHGK